MAKQKRKPGKRKPSKRAAVNFHREAAKLHRLAMQFHVGPAIQLAKALLKELRKKPKR